MFRSTLLVKSIKTLIAIFLGIIFTLVFFEICLFAFSKLEQVLQNSTNNFSKNDEFVILALGESTTASMHDLNMNDYSWPAVLEKLLNTEGLDKKIKVINKGEIAINSDRILNDLEKNIEKYDPDLVISMMGINDSLEGIVYEETAGIEADSLKSKSRTYKLIKFLISNIREKKELKAKEKLDCYSEESCLNLVAQQSNNDFYETQLAIKFLEKALSYNSENVETMISLGYRYMSPYNYSRDDDSDKEQAMKLFKTALVHNPQNVNVYNGLLQSLINTASYEEKWLEQIETDMDIIVENIEKYQIKDANLFLTLATCELCYDKEYFKNESRPTYLNRALETDPQNEHVYLELARYHAQNKNFEEAEKNYLEILNDNSTEQQTIILIELANLYLQTKQETLANEAFKKAVNISGRYTKNYRKIHELLKNKKINLIAVGYPIRSLEPLELIFKDNEDVLFVDNELLFKNLVKEEGYDSIFVDRFAGDFGHCTEKGNLFLAENIKSVILENWEEISGEN